MSYLDATIPPDSEGVKLGASRIRAMAAALNTIIAKVFDDSGNFLSKWVLGAMIANDAAVDANRAIGANHLQNSSVTTRALADGVLSADSTGLGKMADGFFSATSVAQAKVANAFIKLVMFDWASFFTDAPIKATPVAADSILFADSANSNAVKQCTFAEARLAGAFVSAEQAVTTGAVVAVAHGLGAMPKQVRWVLVCKTADLGYSVGDEVAVATARNNNTNNNQAMEGSDTTNVFLVIGTNNWALFNKSTSNSQQITSANWKLKCYASL